VAARKETYKHINTVIYHCYGLFIKLTKKLVPINLLRVLEVWFDFDE